MSVSNGFAVPVMGMHQIEGFSLVSSLQNKTVNGLELLKNLHNVETLFYCSQASLNLEFQCKDDVSELKYTFWD